ncbi:MAG TPA: hypothetical protein VF720_13355 [Candidatus Eisenbacteria bacterium]
MKTVVGLLLLLLPPLLAGCSKGVDPAPPNMEGDWTIHNEATGVETILELDQDGTTLSGSWHRASSTIRVTGEITPTNEFDLTGRSNNDTIVFNAEANDGFSRFTGTVSVYDVRGDRRSLQDVTGRR